MQCRKQITGLLELLPRLYQETQYGEVALGAAVKGALAGLVSYMPPVSRYLAHTLLVWLRRSNLRLLVFSAELGSWSPQVARGSVAVRYGQGKITLLAINTVLAEYGRGTGRGWRGSEHVPVPGAVH